MSLMRSLPDKFPFKVRQSSRMYGVALEVHSSMFSRAGVVGMHLSRTGRSAGILSSQSKSILAEDARALGKELIRLADEADEITAKMREFERADKDKCPSCGSHLPELHPAVQFGGEVTICKNSWHSPLPANIAHLGADPCE